MKSRPLRKLQVNENDPGCGTGCSGAWQACSGRVPGLYPRTKPSLLFHTRLLFSLLLLTNTHCPFLCDSVEPIPDLDARWGGDKGNSAGMATETQDDGDTEGLCQAFLWKCERAYSNRLRLMRTREEARCTLSEAAGNARTDLVPGGYSHSQRKSKQVLISCADTEQEGCGSGSASVLRRKIKAGSRENVRMCRGQGAQGLMPLQAACEPCLWSMRWTKAGDGSRGKQGDKPCAVFRTTVKKPIVYSEWRRNHQCLWRYTKGSQLIPDGNQWLCGKGLGRAWKTKQCFRNMVSTNLLISNNSYLIFIK